MATGSRTSLSAPRTDFFMISTAISSIGADMTAADLLISGLRERGVEWMATLCGHGLDPLLHAAQKGGMRLVDVRNEQTCAYIADAGGRLTRRPGVCAVSS